MRFTLLVLTPPDAGSGARHALGFAEAVLSAGHELACVFFFDAGALTALTEPRAPGDERDLRAGWAALHREAGTPLLACIASAERFGVDASCTGADAPFTLAGLGDLIDAAGRSDRLLTFSG